MSYCISEVRHREFPSASAVGTALAHLGVSLEELVNAFRGYICPLSQTTGKGYESDLAEDLKGYLAKALQRDGLRPTSKSVAPHLLAIAAGSRGLRPGPRTLQSRALRRDGIPPQL